MSYAEVHKVSLTTAVGGAATGYTPILTGKIISIRYVKTDFAAGVDFAITGEITGINIWTQVDQNASVTKSPRQPTHDAAGAASLYDTVSSEPVEDYIVLARERVKIVIAQGGDGKLGDFYVTVG